ncbi:hypothetical protein RBH29_17340 [Herbivorax sp. ANBcel31]|uniref:hypothetical protein n=1 Tax=Herbivorax sp. ANBcel31 TaxID=3069754 RepID=UPI0027B76219|nr:hypothetical protein [Herbivorax sp. ANBcel31]MDQ2088190.1 hypothetical protein [Herbivorax sp. ANBcel31]
MVSGSKSLEDYRTQGANHKGFALFYTRYRGQFTANESILTELGNTTGLLVVQTIAYIMPV